MVKLRPHVLVIVIDDHVEQPDTSDRVDVEHQYDDPGQFKDFGKGVS